MQPVLPDLSGRKSLVLGADDPYAAALALALAQAGSDVAVTSRTGDAAEAFELRPLRRAIEAEGRLAIADIADLGNGSSVQIAVRQIVKQFGRIDMAVITAGAGVDKPAERLTDAEWSRTIGLGFGVYFYACRSLHREFMGNEPVDGVRGRILALLPAVEPATGGAIDLAARAGAEALLLALARDWRPDGILIVPITLVPAMSEAELVQQALAALV